MSESLLLSKVDHSIPPVVKIQNARPRIRSLNQAASAKVVVIDDDPTGCQTVHDIKVLMEWTQELIHQQLTESDCFYVLTNSRASPASEAAEMNRTIAQLLQNSGNNVKVISRSDSTLRGHFYEEVSALSDVLGPYDGVLLVPYFSEGGRLTVHDTHYVLQGEELIPAHQTEFAQDTVFGYRHSHLGDWVEEKSAGKWKKEQVISLFLEDIRQGGEDRVYDKLMAAQEMQPIIVNALADEDLEVVVLGLCRAEAEGKKFLYRTAASFVKIRAGLDNTALYEPGTLGKKGLLIVGSYVQKTTEQLRHLLDHAPVEAIRVNINSVLSDEHHQYRHEIQERVEQTLGNGQPVVSYTERDYVRADQREEQLAAGKMISDFLSAVVRALSVKPDFVIAKGGITSHDIARHGLDTQMATVKGQIAPGVPFWTLDQSAYPGLPYVVFPGNVGERTTLLEVFTKLCH